jgi:hypothetical protein
VGARKLALFDLDGTLLDGDTDELWCEFLMDEGILDRADFEARNRSIVERYRAGTITPAEFCAFYASTLRAARRRPGPPFASASCGAGAPRLGDAARALVASHRDAGDRLVLTTATNRFLTEPIATDLGFGADALIATELAGPTAPSPAQCRHAQHARRQSGASGGMAPRPPASISALSGRDLLQRLGERPAAAARSARAGRGQPDPRLRSGPRRRGWPRPRPHSHP